MKIRKTAAFTAALAILGASLFSCGADEETDKNPDLPDLPVVTATDAEDTTEAATEAETKETTKAPDEEKPTEAEEKPTEADEPSEEATEAPNDENNDDQPDDQPDDEPNEQPNEQPSQIAMDMTVLERNMDDFIAVYGDPQSSEVFPGCLSNGADQIMYTYDGMVVLAYVGSDCNHIYDVTINDGKYPLSTGIAVGAAKSAVESIYGTGETLFERYVYYKDGDSSISFEYDGDTVVSIDINKQV